jgi:hypothetical protein
VSDIDIVLVDSLKALDPNRPIREADISERFAELDFISTRLKEKVSGKSRSRKLRRCSKVATSPISKPHA